MATKTRDFCGINGVALKSSYSQRTIRDIDDTQDFANYLSTFVAVSPIYLILKGNKGAVDVGHNIAQHDWEQFADAMGAVPDLTKEKVSQLAGMANLYTSGKEREFWKCMYEALR